MLVFYHHERRAGFFHQPGYGAHHIACAGGVKVGRGFIEKHYARTHSDDSGERQALLLPTGEPLGGKIQIHEWANQFLSGGHAAPDFLARIGQVFAAEGNVIAYARGDHLRIRVLEHQPHRDGVPRLLHQAAGILQEKLTRAGSFLIGAQHPGHRRKQGGLARSRVATEKHAFTWLDDHVNIG